MRRSVWLALLVGFVPFAAFSQSLVGYGAAAAAGSSAGTVAGHKLNKSLDEVLGKTAQAAKTAAKEEPKKAAVKPAEKTVVPASAAVEPVGQTGSARTRAAIRTSPVALPKAPESVAGASVQAEPPAAPLVVEPTTAALTSLHNGATLDEVEKVLGVPASRISMPEGSHLIEICHFRTATGQDIGTVRLIDGSVTAIQPAIAP